MRGRVTKIKRDVRALSPIFAVLILIAIAVIAGIIVYMFTSGYLGTMMGGGTAGQEKVAIEAVNATASGVTAWCKSTGGGLVVIDEAILKDSAGIVKSVETGLAANLPADGTLTPVTCTFTGYTLASGEVYTVALVSEEGNQFVSSTFKVG